MYALFIQCIFTDSSTLLHLSVVHSSLIAYSIVLYDYVTVCLSCWCPSRLFLVWDVLNKLLWTFFLYKSFGEHVFLFLLNKYLGVELCFIKKRQLLDIFSKVVVPFYTSQQCMSVPVDLQSYTGLVLSSILILFISNEWFIVFMGFNFHSLND